MTQTGPTSHESWTFYIGDTWTIQFNCKNPDGSVMALSGAGLSIVWKIDDGLRTVNWYTKTVGNGLTIVNADAGVCFVQLTPAETSRFVPDGVYTDELTITKAGIVSTMCTGDITVRAKLP